jgi:hypothetical protein
MPIIDYYNVPVMTPGIDIVIYTKEITTHYPNFYKPKMAFQILKKFTTSERMGKIMEPWQERVIEEKKQLDEKIFNLDKFTGENQNISPNQLRYLKMQQVSMKEYSAILQARILDFKKTDKGLKK